jgi:hypothetical protein
MEHRLEISQDGAQLLLSRFGVPVVVAAGIHYFLGFDLCGWVVDCASVVIGVDVISNRRL